MARLLIYDAYENKVYTYANLNENDPMPYSTLTTLRLREFRGKSSSPTLWTTIAAMEAWNLTRRKYGRGIPVGYAFRRIWEGGHGTRSQHYAGVAFDVGQSLDQRQRTAPSQNRRQDSCHSRFPTWEHKNHLRLGFSHLAIFMHHRGSADRRIILHRLEPPLSAGRRSPAPCRALIGLS